MTDDPGELRNLPLDELVRLGQESLRQTLLAQAMEAHRRYGGLTAENYLDFLRDASCIRFPTRLVFGLGEMASHQFGDVTFDPEDPEQKNRVLCLRPWLEHRPGQLLDAVAFMIPLANYGEAVGDDDCLAYGATLRGVTEEEFYQRICELADDCGATPLERPSES